MAVIDKIAQGMGYVTKSKPLTKLGNAWHKDPEGVLGATTVTSIILKDGIGCAMYVAQSLNNDRIPEEKRRFVAALDLTNGLLMIGAQIALFLGMRKYSGKIFDKFFGKTFNRLAQSQAVSRVRMHAAKLGESVMKKLGIEKIFKDKREDALSIFKFVLEISAATIVGKRIVVPLIATPLAKKVEKRMNKNDKGKVPENPEVVENTYNTTKHFGDKTNKEPGQNVNVSTSEFQAKKSPFSEFKIK